MNDRQITRIAIVGGGTAGWMAAAGLCTGLAGLGVRIRLIEAPHIATIGVGEATIPSIVEFVHQLGIPEQALVREVGATYKLGIAYRDWSRVGDFYFHPFGPLGRGLGNVGFAAYWLKMYLAGQAGPLEHYSIQAAAALRGRFTRPVHAPNTPLNKIAYALHFDATRFAQYLRRFAQARGVERLEGEVKAVRQRPTDGHVESLVLDSGERIHADLFIDCSGFRGVLIEDALKSGYEDWRDWLPCDRAMVVQSKRAEALDPFTTVTGRPAGWQWQIPLQHRRGNGYVYCSEFTTREDVAATLLAPLRGTALGEPTELKFAPGRRRVAWNKNVVALGLAAGFLEPLEATSIHLIQRGIAMLLKFFPDRDFAAADISRYNRTLEQEFARVRDFLLLHYTQTARDDPFWAHCRNIRLTDSLNERLALFRSHGRILREESELFPPTSWLAVMVGQHVVPQRYDPLVDGLATRDIHAQLERLRHGIEQRVEAMPLHAEYLHPDSLRQAHGV